MEQARRYVKPHACGFPSLSPEVVETRVGRVEVGLFGNPLGPALILLPHGLGDCSALSEIACELAVLKPHLRYVSVSRPGSGATPPMKEGVSDPLSFEARSILPALMDALDIHAAHLVAHADGASVALTFASLFPDRTLSVVGLAAYGFADDYLREILEPMRSRADGPHSLSNLSSACDPEKRFLRWREDRLRECEKGWNATTLLGNVTAPITLIQGARDEFLSLDQSAAISARVNSDVCWITLQNAGHFVHLDNPQQIIMLVRRQLEQAHRPIPPMLATDDPNPASNWQKKASVTVRSHGRESRSLPVASATSGWLLPA